MSATISSHRATLTPRGDFSLAASIRFLEGFTPLATDGRDRPADTLRLAFCVEGDWRVAGVSAHETDGGRVNAEITGAADIDLARAQLERILSLDVDASSLRRRLRGDRVATELVEELRGLRPVLFASPYEAAAWAVLSQRVQMRQAAKIRARICEQYGEELEVDGETMHAFPAPEALLAIDAIQSLPTVKIDRLHAVAQAALQGRLGATTLREAGPERALHDVQEIPGIGPFGAELVVIRGAGEPDHFPRTERRLHGAMADAYDIDVADVDALAQIAEGWRPFRSWLGFLFRARLALRES